MAPRGAILVVDDEERIVRNLARALRAEGHEVATATHAAEARCQLAARPFDLLVVDQRMPDKSGLELIRELVGATPAAERPQIVMMTAHATVDHAIEAMKLGALDFLQKPFDVEALLALARRAVEHQRLRVEHRYLIEERGEEFDHYGIVGRSRAVQELIERIERVARSKSTVLITGETGTGKELVARALHDRSDQRDLPLIKVNCAAIPETLIESELFGYVRGAFTGATGSKKGKFALADGGSLFLDEIGTLPPGVQPKLLRVLQEREFEPLGAERPQTVDVRVIAATNRDLGRMVAEGRFQQDLFYRLSVIPLHLPPLRERREDIPLLAEHFLHKHRQRCGKRVERLDDEALRRLTAYDWPGNVRELENAVERAVVLAGGAVIGAEQITLVAAAAPPPGGLPSRELRKNVEWAERESIRRALELAGGVKKDAAEILGLSQRALSHYLAKHDIA
jgi:DNA-binding NtrC family response regulator